MRVTGPEQADHALQVILVDQADVAHLHRVRQQRQTGRVRDERAFQKRHVQPLDVHGHVGERVHRHQIERDVGVSQGHVEIDESDAVFCFLGQGAAQVHGDAGAADAAARAKDGND